MTGDKAALPAALRYLGLKGHHLMDGALGLRRANRFLCPKFDRRGKADPGDPFGSGSLKTKHMSKTEIGTRALTGDLRSKHRQPCYTHV